MQPVLMQLCTTVAALCCRKNPPSLHQTPASVWSLLHLRSGYHRARAPSCWLVAAGGGSILTEIEKLLHGERRGGELREVLDVFGRTGQGGVFHDKPDELHGRCCVLRLPQPESDRSPARLLTGRGGAIGPEEPAPANGETGSGHAPQEAANRWSSGRGQRVWVLPGRKPVQTGASPHLLCNVYLSDQSGEKQAIKETMWL